MDEREKLIASFQEIARYDWFVSTSYNRLHWAELTADQLADVPDYWSMLPCHRHAAGQGVAEETTTSAGRCLACPRGKRR